LSSINLLKNKQLYIPREKKNKCYFCQKVGHLARNCWKKKESLKANTTKESKEEDFTFAMGEDNTPYHESWIIDSGASSHMSNSRLQLQMVRRLKLREKELLQSLC